jgi:hypothetical protein
MPRRFFQILRWEAGRPISALNGCRKHTNVCDLLEWGDGPTECLMCARDRQESRMTPEQKRNPAFYMPTIENWTK